MSAGMVVLITVAVLIGIMGYACLCINPREDKIDGLQNSESKREEDQQKLGE